MSVETADAGLRYSTLPQRRNLLLSVLIGLFVLALASLVYALGSEAMRPDFGLLTVSFLYLLGVSQAGVVFCAMTRLMHAQWAKPYYRLAELGTLAFCPFAFGVLLLIWFWGRDELFYWVGSHEAAEHSGGWLSGQWLLIRDFGGLILFYGLSAIYVLKGIRRDMSGNAASDSDARQTERQLYLMSPWVIVAFVICNTFIAWDFGMMLTPHWHSTVFPIYFWFGNLFAGSAALIAIPALLRRFAGSPFEPHHIRSLGMLLTAFTLMWLYFFWAQFFVIWFGNLPREFEPLWRQMYGHYAPYYWTMMSGFFFVPFGAFIFAAVRRSLAALCAIAVSVNVALWLNKYLIVVSALSTDHRPFDAWLDIVLALGLLAGFLATLLGLSSRLPIYSRWELQLKGKPQA